MMSETRKPTKPRSPMVRWSARLEALPALSVKQPWAWLIVAGFKDVENRSWRTKHRGPVLIHAGLSRDLIDEDLWKWLWKKYRVWPRKVLPFGGIVGVVDLVDCVETHKSPWFAGEGFGFVLANPRRLRFRPCKGKLMFFKPEFEEE